MNENIVKRTRMGKFVVKNKNGNWNFTIHAGNGEIIFCGKSKNIDANSCVSDIRHLQKHGHDVGNYRLLQSDDNRFYFTFVSPEDNDIKGTSQMYERAAERTVGLESVIFNSQSAKIDIDGEV